MPRDTDSPRSAAVMMVFIAETVEALPGGYDTYPNFGRWHAAMKARPAHITAEKVVSRASA